MNTKKWFMLSACLVGIFQFFCFTFSSPAQAASLWSQQEGLGAEGDNQVGQIFDANGTPKDIRMIIVDIIKIILGFIGILLVGLIVFAGFKYMTAQGNDTQVSEAVSQIKNAIIGLIIILSAFAIADYTTSCLLDISQNNQSWMCKGKGY